MTGYEITKSIFSFSAENPKVKANHISTFIYFGEILNECNWVPLIEISREKLLKIAGIGTQRTYKKVLEDLVSWEAVKVHNYSSNQFNPYDVVEIDKRFVKKTKSLLNHYEINALSEQKQSNDTYIKTNKHFNLKTYNDMEIFFEKNDFEKFQNMEVSNQKLIKENLKVILKKNFDFLSTQDLSQIEFEIKFRAEICSNFKDLEEKVANDISTYFGISELNNFRLYRILNHFVQFLSQNNQLTFFDSNFFYYKTYKEMTAEMVHGFEKFIGQPEKNYENGAWLSENYMNKVKNFEKNLRSAQNHIGKNGKPDLSIARLNVIDNLNERKSS